MPVKRKRRSSSKRRNVNQGASTNFQDDLDSSVNRKIPKINNLTTFVFIGVVIVVNAVLLSFFLGKDKQKKKQQEELAENIVVYAPKDTRLSEQALTIKDMREVEAVIDELVKARTVEEALPYLYNSDVEEKAFRKSFKPLEKVVYKTHSGSMKYSDGSRYAFYSLHVGGVEREVLMRALPNGEFKFDWKSLYLYGDMAFTEYAEHLPEGEHVVLCYLQGDCYFTRDFTEKVYQSYSLMDFSGDNKVIGFMNLENRQYVELLEAVYAGELSLHGKSTVRAAVTLKLKGKKPLPVVEIVKVDSLDWLVYE